MGVEKLLPEIVTVSKNLDTGELSFEVQGGTLTKTEEKLFTEDSNIVILKNYYGDGIDYSKQGAKTSEIIDGTPITKINNPALKREVSM